MCRRRVGRRSTYPSGASAGLPEQQPSKLSQVPPPDHPCVHSRRFDVGVIDSFGLQPLAQVAVYGDQTILGAAGNPQQFELLVGFCVERWEIFFKIVGDTARTESADPGELVEIIQPG